MQNRYVGDIGDFTKLALLRALPSGRRLAVACWLHPDAGPPGDGRHVNYLSCPERWRRLDPDMFDALSRIVAAGDRRVAAIETAGLLPSATWLSEEIPTTLPWRDRAARRRLWFSRVLDGCSGADVVFADPDNGLEPSRFNPGRRSAAKSISTAELLELKRPGRTHIVSHHQTRTNGTHLNEIALLSRRLHESGFSTVDAVRAKASSPRVYFILDSDTEIRGRLESLCDRWGDNLTWHRHV